MGISKRTHITADNICCALKNATAEQTEAIKNTLNISGFHYSGSGFYFYGDSIGYFDGSYVVDGGTEN
jgi:hypothetical protein